MHGKEVDATRLNQLELTLQVILNIILQELMDFHKAHRRYKNEVDAGLLYHNFDVNNFTLHIFDVHFLQNGDGNELQIDEFLI